MSENLIQMLLLIVQTLTFVAIVIYVWKTWTMASATKKAAEASEKSIDEMRRTREEESRPYVVIYFKTGLDGATLELIIKNIGKLPAKNVTFELDQKLQQGDWNRFELISDSPKFTEGIKFLPPNLELKEFFAGFINVENLRSAYRVLIRYENSLSGQKYMDEQTLEWKSLTGTIGAGDEWFRLVEELKEKVFNILTLLEKFMKKQS